MQFGVSVQGELGTGALDRRGFMSERLARAVIAGVRGLTEDARSTLYMHMRGYVLAKSEAVPMDESRRLSQVLGQKAIWLHGTLDQLAASGLLKRSSRRCTGGLNAKCTVVHYVPVDDEGYISKNLGFHVRELDNAVLHRGLVEPRVISMLENEFQYMSTDYWRGMKIKL